MMLTKIGKREARARYNANRPIAMAGEPDWFNGAPRDYQYATLLTHATHGDFDALVDMSQDSRYKSPRVSYAKPVECGDYIMPGMRCDYPRGHDGFCGRDNV